MDLDIPNDEKIKNNNLIFQQSNNDLLKLKGRKKIINDTKYIIRKEDLKFLQNWNLF